MNLGGTNIRNRLRILPLARDTLTQPAASNRAAATKKICRKFGPDPEVNEQIANHRVDPCHVLAEAFGDDRERAPPPEIAQDRSAAMPAHATEKCRHFLWRRQPAFDGRADNRLLAGALEVQALPLALANGDAPRDRLHEGPERTNASAGAPCLDECVRDLADDELALEGIATPPRATLDRRQPGCRVVEAPTRPEAEARGPRPEARGPRPEARGPRMRRIPSSSTSMIFLVGSRSRSQRILTLCQNAMRSHAP